MTFSIAIPAYKSDFLKECIESILGQTYTAFELIVVNDCSPQPIDAIIAQFNDKRLKYFKNDVNIGAERLVTNWNNCLAKATGDFFMMMGDDDTMDADFLTEFISLINKYPDLDVFHCRSKIINERSEPYKLSPSWPGHESVYDNIWHRIKDLRLQYVSDFVYRTTVLKNNGGYFYLPLAWGADDITAYIACGTKGIAHTNKPVFNYRQTEQTISSTGSPEKKIEAFNMRKKWFNNFLSVKPIDPIDQIIYSNICLIYDAELQRMKLTTLSHWLADSTLKGLWITLRSRHTFQVSLSEVAKAFLVGLKFKYNKAKKTV